MFICYTTFVISYNSFFVSFLNLFLITNFAIKFFIYKVTETKCLNLFTNIKVIFIIKLLSLFTARIDKG